MERHQKMIIETHDDLRRLYALAVRDNAKGFSLEEAEQKLQRAMGNTAYPSFDNIAVRLNYIYEKTGYAMALRCARIAARFDSGRDFDLQDYILDVLEDMAGNNKNLFPAMVRGIESAFADIEKRKSVMDEIGRITGITGENVIAVIFFGADNSRYVTVGDPEELCRIATNMKNDGKCDKKLDSMLDFIIKRCNAKREDRKMLRLERTVGEELNGSATKVIENLKRKIGNG